MNSFRSGWTRTSLGVLAGSGQYGWTTKASATGCVRFLRTTDITRPTIDWATVPYCAEVPTDQEKYTLAAGDIVISRAGSVGFSKLLESPPEPTLFASYLIRFKPTQAVHPRFLAAYLRSDEYWRYIGATSAGIALANVNASSLSRLEVPLPPLAEQKRIADKLGAVLARVDTINTRLARVTPILKRFRRSVLDAATSGRLTEDWRTDKSLNLEGIPSKWASTSLRSCIASMSGGASPTAEDYALNGVLALNKGDIKLYGKLARKKDQNRVPEAFAELHRSKMVRPGALLVTLRDLSNKADFLGLIAQYAGTEVALPTQGMYALSVTPSVVPRYLMYFSNSPFYREIVKQEKVGATQVHLRNDQFLDIPISLPSVEEQAEIVRRVEALFAFADRLDARIQTTQTATERLTPALLAKAFRGELVPQEPNDEPASELLRRLLADVPSSSPARRRKAAV